MNCRSVPRLESPRSKTSIVVPTTVSAPKVPAPGPNISFSSFKTTHSFGSSVAKPSLSTAPSSHSNMERQQYQRQNLEIVRHYKLKSVQVRETEDRLSRLEKENLGLRHDLNNAMKKLLSQNKDTTPILASSSSPLLSVDTVFRDGSTRSSEENYFGDVHSHRHDSLKRKRRSDSRIRNSKAYVEHDVPHREEGFDENDNSNPAVEDKQPQTKRQREQSDFRMPMSGSFLAAKLDETEVIYQRQHESLCAMMESFKSTSQFYRDLLRKVVKVTVPKYQDVDQESVAKSDKHRHRLRPLSSPSSSPLPTLSTPRMPRSSAHEKRSLYSRSPHRVEHSPSPSPFFLSGRRLWEKSNRHTVRDGGDKAELSQSPKLRYKNYRMPVAKAPGIYSQTSSSSWSAESTREKLLAAVDEDSTTDTSVTKTAPLLTQRTVRSASRIHHRISALPSIAEHSSHAKSVQSSPQIEPVPSLQSVHNQTTAWKIIPAEPVLNVTPAARLERPQTSIVRNLKRGPESQAPQAQEPQSASHNRLKNMPVTDSTVPSFAQQSPGSNGWDMVVVRSGSSADPSQSTSNEATTLNNADDATNDKPDDEPSKGLDNGLNDGTNDRTNCNNSCEGRQEETIGIGRASMKRSADAPVSKARSNNGNGARNKRRLIRLTMNKLRASPSPMIKSRSCISVAQLKKMTPKQLLYCMNKSLLGTTRAPVLTKAIIQNATASSTRYLTLGSDSLSKVGDTVRSTVPESMPSPPTPPSRSTATRQSEIAGQQEKGQVVAVMIPCMKSHEIGTKHEPNPVADGNVSDIEPGLSGADDNYDTCDTGSQDPGQNGQYQDMLEQHQIASRIPLKRTARSAITYRLPNIRRKLVPGEPGTYSLLTPRRPALRNRQQINHKKKHAKQQSRGSRSTDNHDSEPSNH